LPVDGDTDDHQRDCRVNQVRKFAHPLSQGGLPGKVIFLYFPDSGAQAHQRGVQVGKLAAHGRHALPGFVRLVVSKVRENQLRLLHHFIHGASHGVHLLQQNPGLICRHAGAHFVAHFPHLFIESNQRQRHFGRFRGYIVRIEHVVTRRIDRGGQLAEVGITAEPLRPFMVDPHGTRVNSHQPVAQVETGTNGEQDERRKQ